MTNEVAGMADEIATWRLMTQVADDIAEAAGVCADALSAATWDGTTFRIDRRATRARDRSQAALDLLFRTARMSGWSPV